MCSEHVLSTYCVSGRWAFGARAPSPPPEGHVHYKLTFIQLTHGPLPGSVPLGGYSLWGRGWVSRTGP